MIKNDIKANIKAGDTVFLKSGGPEMTVSMIRTQRHWFESVKVAKCFFWNEAKGKYVTEGHISERTIPVDALELSPPFDTKEK